MATSATVTALSGKVIVIDLAGVPRLLAVGDTVQAGDTVRPAPGASVRLQPDVGAPLNLGDSQAWLVGSEAPVTAQPALTEAINAVLDVLERGGDLDELEAAAAGVGGGGGGDGSSFVRLLRIAEGVTPLAYEYGADTPGRIDEPLLATVVVAEGDEPPPPADQYPNATDDTAQASVTITKNAITDFNGSARVMGAGEGAASFEGRLALPHNQQVWLLSDASFQAGLSGGFQGEFTITDQGQGSDPAFVVTPNFTAQAGQTFSFNALTQLGTSTQPAGVDAFTAEVYRLVDGAWVRQAAIPGTEGVYSHTFAEDGEYRVKFTVDDETPGTERASATIDVGSDHFFSTVTPLPDVVDIVPATGNILSNDTLGDGDWSQHSWQFDGGVVDAETGWVTVAGSYGTLVVEPDGAYTYTPSGTAGGSDTFSYTLADSDGDLDAATLSVGVAYTVNDLSTLGDVDDGASLSASGYTYAGAEAVDLPVFAADDDNDSDGFTLAHVDEGGDSIDLGDMLDVPEFSAQVLDPYLSFEQNDAGHAVMQVATGADLNGDGIPDALQSFTFDNVSLLDLQAYAGGSSDVEIIQKLLDNGNLRKDA